MKIRLGFHYHVPFQRVDGRIKTAGLLGRFVDSLSPHCEVIYCFAHSPLESEVKLMDYSIQSKNVEFVDIGPHVSGYQRTLHANKFAAPVQEYAPRMDIMLVRAPTPLLPAIHGNLDGTPLALLLVGDYIEAARVSDQPLWRKSMVMVWSWMNQTLQNRAAQNALTFVNSRKLYEQFDGKLPHLYETRTTTLENTDFHIREDTCQQKPYRLLFTGRINKSKGVLDVVKAVALLTERGEDVVFDMVGWADTGEGIFDEMKQLATQHGIEDRIIYHGYKSVGEELFAYYRQSDIYVIASQSNFEGFPRSVWESLAHSLPVVATRVGSIPYFLEDRKHVYLVDPRQPEAFAEAIYTLIHDSDLRQYLMQEGIQLARENTLERRAKDMMYIIQQWLAKHHPASLSR